MSKDGKMSSPPLPKDLAMPPYRYQQDRGGSSSAGATTPGPRETKTLLSGAGFCPAKP